MWSQYVAWLLLGSFVGPSYAIFEPTSPNCVAGEYWCQDRCGSDSYGQICCGTPDGQHNLCGANLKCCLYGCCPNDTNCNAVGACERTITTTDSSGNPTTSVITVAPTDTLTNPPVGDPTATPTTTTQADGQTVVIVNTVTVTVPPGLSTQSIVTTEGQTITLGPTEPPTGDTPAPITTTNPDGQTVVIVGTVTVPVPTDLTTQTVVTTDGQTVTLDPPQPPVSGDPAAPTTTTNTDGQTVVIVGPVTVPVPADLTSQTVVTTDGQTVTLDPPQPPTSDEPPAQTTTTQDDGQTVVIVGTLTVPVPPGLTSQTLVTTEGQTITLDPVTAGITVTTPTLTEGQTAVTVGSITIPISTGLTTTSTVTTDGQTIIITPPPGGENTDPPVTEPTDTDTDTTEPTDTDTDLPVIPTWPPFQLEPIPEDVEEPETDDDGTKVPCKLWFFSICISFGGINIGGWRWPPLPPGIYPPGPPPGIEFPPGFSIEGTLPPWPKITIGNDNKPTFDEEPTSCETQTASMFATTTSYEVSVSGTVTSTTGSQVITTSAPIVGCNVRDDDSSQSGDSTCVTSTVTDEWLSCTSSPGDASSVCETTSSSTVTGCDITATTHSCTSTSTVAPGETGVVKRMDGVCIVQGPSLHVVYPPDGTDTANTDAIQAVLDRYDLDDLYRSDTNTVGINFWLATMTSEQASQIAVELAPQNAIVYLQSSTRDPGSDDDDPGTEVVYQPPPPPGESPSTHLTFVSQQQGANFDSYQNRYYFDDSAVPGEDIPLYLIDTGANLDQKDFTGVRDKARWINIGTDVDGSTNTHDDSGTDPSNSFASGKSHGTSMLSLATGDRVGVSKSVSPILVRMPRRVVPAPGAGNTGGSTYEDYIEGFSKICDELTGTNAETSAIVLMALYFKKSNFDRTGNDYSAGFSGRLNFLLKDLVNKGAFIVTGTGNDNEPTIDGWPANFGKTGAADNIPQLLVVGGTNANPPALYGNTDYGAGLPHVAAPASGFRTADGNRGQWGLTEFNDQYKGASGTSCSTAITAGLAAYFLKLARVGTLQFDTSPQGLKDYIISLAWARPGVQAPGIWNGAIPRLSSCPWNPTGASKLRFMRRQEDDQCKVPPELTDPDSSTDDGDTSTDGDTTTDDTGAPTDLPTLTPTATDCADGSTCLSSATSTSCVMPGGGHGSACVTNTYCASCSANPSLPTPTWGELQCNPPNSEHEDIHKDTQADLARGTCDSYTDYDLDSSDTSQIGQGSLSYWYGFQWEEGCETSEPTQNIVHPLGPDDKDCYYIMTNLYLQCTDNGGAGGHIVVGCIRYTFDAVSPYADDRRKK